MSLRLGQILRHLSAPASVRSPLSSLATNLPSLPFRGSAVSLNMPAATPSAAKVNATKPIHTAACLIIGDEVLGGKTKDTNSAFFAEWCFSLGINLKRIEVIEDDESQIIEAVRRMSAGYDFVVTSGGIGPTHDDITYPSIAKAFGLQLRRYPEAHQRMRELSRARPGQAPIDWDDESTPEMQARLRMVNLPSDPALADEDQCLFPNDDLWVPVAVVNGNVHILPGVPRIFEMLLTALHPILQRRIANKGITRVLVSTPLPESSVATYLTELAARVGPRGVKVGSYPRWNERHNTVTLVGTDKDYIESLVPEVERNVKGRRVEREGEDDDEPMA